MNAKKCKHCGSWVVKATGTKVSDYTLFRYFTCLQCNKEGYDTFKLKSNKLKPKAGIWINGKSIPLKKFVYESYNNVVLPEGSKLVFKNGDTADYRPWNLVAVEPGNLEAVPELTVQCKRCDNIWIPRRADPKACPACQSVNWNLKK